MPRRPIATAPRTGGSGPPSRSPARGSQARRRAFRASVEVLEELVLMSTYPVTSTADSGAGTLRAAIDASNQNPGQLNAITFNLASSGIQIITPASALPTITAPVVIDGTTEPGYRAAPLVQLYGGSAGANVNGLVLSASNATIKGLIVSSFGNDGIEVFGNGNLIAANYVGTGTHGLASSANGREGILVNGANNTIGGLSNQGLGNVISGNTDDGIDVFGSNTTGTVIQGNWIGTDAGGDATLFNGRFGILVNQQATTTLIGTNGDGVNDINEKNTISGNRSYGIEIADAGTIGNVVAGNGIGVDATGTFAIGNSGGGIFLSNGANANRIGTDGVSADDAGQANVIAGNNAMGAPGIKVTGAGTDGNVIAGNLIGLDRTGTVAIGNGGVGVFIEAGAKSTRVGTDGNGQGDLDERNVIAASAYQGLYIGGVGTDGTIVAGNLIGTDATGRVARGNLNNGIWVDAGAQATRIGVKSGDPGASAEGNVIAASGFAGVLIHASGTNGHLVAGNFIGTDASGTLDLGNGFSGVAVDLGSRSNTIGGTFGTLGNVIAFNHQAGVAIDDSGTSGNQIQANRIYANLGLGIDLGGDGVTVNHIGDTSTGPNGDQNYPAITSTTPGSNTLVAGTLSSLPNQIYTLDFYASTRPDPSYFGAARVYLGSVGVTTNGLGEATFKASLGVATTAGQWVSLTATGPGGDTSEFSQAEPLPWQGLGRNAATWTAIGPGPIAAAPVYSGRIEQAAADPTDPNVMYVAADGGGIWKTLDWLDPSPIWTPLTDARPSLGAGSDNLGYHVLAVAPSRPATVYAAVGGPGGGILKSTDSGASWVELANVLFDRVNFGSLVISPTDPNTLYVTVWDHGGAAPGLYKSTDGGATWANKTTAVHNGPVSDVVIDPTTPTTLYAGMVQGAGGGATNGIYKSTDGGATWARSASGTLSGSAVGVSIRLAIAPSNPQVLYATVFDPALGNSPNGLPHRYVTTNGAATWKALAALASADEGRYWHAVLAVDPSNPAIVYTNGDHSTYRSADSGLTWSAYPFDDPVSVSFDDQGADILTGDRGIYRSSNGGAPYLSKQGNLQTAELYTLTLDPTNINVAYGISQDQLAGLKFTGGLAWAYLGSGGEVGKVLVDPTHPARIYSFDPNAGGSGSGTISTSFVQRSEDGGATWTSQVNGLDTSIASFNYAYASQKAFAIDPSNPSRLILGGRHVYETTNQANTWTDISPSGFAGNPDIVGLAVAPSAGATLYVGTANGHLYATTNDGASWSERDSGLPLDAADAIVNFQVDPANPNHVFITTGTFANNLTGPARAWVTSDGGLTWVDIKGDLPADDFTTSLAVDWRGATPTLYLGTARGVFSSTNLGSHWAPYKTGLPNAEVNDLEFLPQFNLLAAASYGRGVFEILTAPATSIVVATASATTTTYGQTVTFTATLAAAIGQAIPTGTVQFLVDGNAFGSPVALVGGVASLASSATLGAGTHFVTASFSGDTTYAGSTGGFTEVVSQAHLAVVPDDQARPVGQANPALTYHLLGFVAGEDATSAGVAGSPTLTTTAVASSPAGTYPITVTSASTLAAANYDFPAGSFGTGTLTVSAAKSTTQAALAIQPVSTTFGQKATLTATISVVGGGATPTGLVTFLDGTTTLGTATLDGSGVATLAVANLAVSFHPITAAYGGDANDQVSTSPTVGLFVGQDATATTLAAAPGTSAFGQSVTLTATVGVVAPGVGSPSGLVTFSDGPNVLGTATISGGVAVLSVATLGVGSHSLTASYAGDARSAVSISASSVLIVRQAPTATTLAIAPTTATFGRPVTLTANVAALAPGAGRPTGPVIFYEGSTPLGSATLDGSGRASLTLANLAFGIHAISAAYPGDSNDAISGSAPATIRVGDAAPSDFEGTGKTNLAVFLPKLGAFAIRSNLGKPDQLIPFGIPGVGNSIPAVGDYDGSGKAELAVFLPTLGAFAYRPANGGPDKIVYFGIPGAGNSIPAPGDYDGSGHTEIAIYLPTLGAFAYRPANGGPDKIIYFGIPGAGNSIAAPGDFDGSGQTEIAVYLPTLGAFAYRPAKGGADRIIYFGSPGAGLDLPTTALYLP